MPDAAMSIAPADEDLCLAFANTRYWRGRAAPTETLSAFPDLLHWLAGSAALPPPALERAAAWGRDRPGEAATLFDSAIGLREAIYRAFAAVADGAPVAEDDLRLLNEALAGAPPRIRLVRAAARYAWAAAPVPASTGLLLAPVLWSAADLLTHLDRYRVRRCANDECLWLFVDHSKGGTRRWCDMSSCGNRAKSRRHYARTRPPAHASSA